jgi:peptide/nickel transport system permease protein
VAFYILRRILYMIPTLIVISIVSFIIIQLPPGDYLTTVIAELQAQGGPMDPAQLIALRERYGLGDPVYIQYWKWITGIILRGDFGQSFLWDRPVIALVLERLPLTIIVAFGTLVVTWLIAFPVGVYSAIRQYSIGDYIATTFGFIGLAVPSFLIALILMYVGFRFFGQSVGGLFSPQYVDAPWSWEKLGDFLAHVWVPVVVLGTAGTAALIRILRANLLDELHRPYVVAARARGLRETNMLVKYPLRVALNPFVSTVGWILPMLVSGDIIVGRVLSLPTIGPLLLNSLISQDMYLAGSIIMIVSVFTVIGTLVSDIALAWLDPRVRLGVA